MNERLDDLLRDPRAHGGVPEAEEVRAWGERALTRWQAEHEARPAAKSRPRWQDLALLAGGAAAAIALLPLLAAIGVRLFEGASALSLDVPQVSWSEYYSSSPLLLPGAAALVVGLAVPQVREMLSRLLD